MIKLKEGVVTNIHKGKWEYMISTAGADSLYVEELHGTKVGDTIYVLRSGYRVLYVWNGTRHCTVQMAEVKYEG